MKGDYQDTCYRTACNAKQNVIFYNTSTKKYYCPSCAKKINAGNNNQPICIRKD